MCMGIPSTAHAWRGKLPVREPGTNTYSVIVIRRDRWGRPYPTRYIDISKFIRAPTADGHIPWQMPGMHAHRQPHNTLCRYNMLPCVGCIHTGAPTTHTHYIGKYNVHRKSGTSISDVMTWPPVAQAVRRFAVYSTTLTAMGSNPARGKVSSLIW